MELPLRKLCDSEFAVSFFQRKGLCNSTPAGWKSPFHKDFHDHFCPTTCDGTRCRYVLPEFTEVTVKAIPRAEGDDTVRWGRQTYTRQQWQNKLEDMPSDGLDLSQMPRDDVINIHIEETRKLFEGDKPTARLWELTGQDDKKKYWVEMATTAPKSPTFQDDKHARPAFWKSWEKVRSNQAVIEPGAQTKTYVSGRACTKRRSRCRAGASLRPLICQRHQSGASRRCAARACPAARACSQWQACSQRCTQCVHI